MELYWDQRKVYLYGILALFPYKLKIKELSELEKFAKGTLTYTARQTLLFELIDYLTKYESHKLSTAGKIIPARFISQQESLVLAARKRFDDYGYRPAVDLVDIWQDPKERIPLKTTFWELILTEHYRAANIDIIKMGYEGTYIDTDGKKLPLPYAEFEVRMGTSFQKSIEPPKLKKAKPTDASNIVNGQPVLGYELQSIPVGMTVEGAIYAELAKSDKRLIKNLRRDSAPYNFMSHMLGHQKQDIRRIDIQTKVDDCASKKNMTELAKQCGFTKELLPLKALYFGGTTETKVRFKATADLTLAQRKLLMQCEKLIA